MANAAFAPVVDVASSGLFPLINQASVVANEGLHEGGAYSEDSKVLPGSYTLDENWNLVAEQPLENLNGAEREAKGKKLLNNTVNVVITAIPGPKANLVEKATTTVVKGQAKKAVEKALDVKEGDCSEFCEGEMP